MYCTLIVEDARTGMPRQDDCYYRYVGTQCTRVRRPGYGSLSLARALSRSRHGWVLDVPPCSGPNPVRAKKCTSLLLIDDTRASFFLR